MPNQLGGGEQRVVVLSRVVRKEILKEENFPAQLWMALLAYHLLSHVSPTSAPEVYPAETGGSQAVLGEQKSRVFL